MTDEVRALGPTATTRATALVLATPIAMIATVLPALAQLIDGRPTPMTPTMAACVCTMFALGPLILRWTKSPNLAGAWALLGAVVATAVAAAQKQGIDSILMVWFLLIPMIASFLLGARWTAVFTVISVLLISSFWIFAGDTNPVVVESPAFRWLNEHVRRDRVVFRSGDGRALKYAMLNDVGLGFLSVWEAAQHPELVQICMPRDEWSAPLWLVTHVDLHRTAKVQAFLRHIKDEAKTWN